MHRNTLWLIFAILCIYFSLVFCKEYTKDLESKDLNDLLTRDITALEEQARTRKRHRHHLYSLWGFYGLAIAYLVKVKLVVVAFFVGSAIYLGLRYLWPHKCAGGGEIYKEGSIVLDHPPSFTHHDHIPYSLDHDHYQDHPYDSGSFGSSGPTAFEPYSAYSHPSYSESDGSFTGSSYTESEGHSESLPSNVPSFRRKRSTPEVPQEHNKVTGILENLARQIVVNEEQIGDFMLSFLGLDTNACRRRFICEMEFRSKLNPLTSMAFRIIGRSFFAQYTNNQNPLRIANSFTECAAVNAECVFIENNEETTLETQQEEHISASEESEQPEEPNDVKNEITRAKTSLESNDVLEKENESNLKAELRRHFYRRRLKGDRNLKLL